MFRIRYLLSALAMVVAAVVALSYEGSTAKDSLRVCRGGACDYNRYRSQMPNVPYGWGLTNYCGFPQFDGTKWNCTGNLIFGPYCSQCGPSSVAVVVYNGYHDNYLGDNTLSDGSSDCDNLYEPGCKVEVVNGVNQCTCLMPTTADLVGPCTIANIVNCSRF